MNGNPTGESSAERERKLIDAALQEVIPAASGATVVVPPRQESFAQPPAGSFTGYEIVREVHRGGQGVVYQAIQKATRRKVAIKVMKEGPFADAREIARFEREVQILGQMKHPNIVAIHDTGEAAGHFYFVMDYISGQPLDVYMASGKRSIDGTLRLFTKICEAINAAHLRGVIHRDLKPGNIIIDADGEPRVLDFGLAKIATGEVTDESKPILMTMTGQFLGSLPWASPEQAVGNPEQIDIRTDVYSLGVILYEMLTGQFPYEVVGKMQNVLDNILNVEPQKPSTVRRQINDEVETIVLKCLSKERERRYQTAGELARDIQHYLAGEPIEAKRDSGWYVMKKTLLRYKVRTSLAATFLGAGFIFGIAVTMLWQGAEAQAHENSLVAETAQIEAQQAKDQARQAEARSRKNSRIAETLAAFVTSLDPKIAEGLNDERLLDILDQLVGLLQDSPMEPESEAKVRTTVGRAYLSLGRYAKAKHHLQLALDIRQRVFPQEDPQVATSLHNLAWALTELAELDEAERLYDAAIAMRRRLFGAESLQVAASLNDLGMLYFNKREYDRAESLLSEALEVRRADPEVEPIDLVESLATLGSTLRARGSADELDQSEVLLREALEISKRVLGSHTYTIAVMNKLVLVRLQRGNYVQAESLARDTLKLRRELLPERHSHVAVSLHNLALALRGLQQYDEAIRLHDEAIDVWRTALGADHHNLAIGKTGLAMTLRASGDLAQAEARCREALDILARNTSTAGPGVTAGTRYALGRTLMDQSDFRAAEEQLRISLVWFSQNEPDQWRTGRGRSALGGCLLGLSLYEYAEEDLLEGYAQLTDKRGPTDKDTVEALRWLVQLYEAMRQPDEAAQYRDLMPPGADASTPQTP